MTKEEYMRILRRAMSDDGLMARIMSEPPTTNKGED